MTSKAWLLAFQRKLKSQAQLGWGFFNRLSKRERNFLIAAALVLSVWAAEAGVIGPMRQHLAALQKDIVIHEKQAAHNLRSLAQKSQVNAAYQVLMQSLDQPNAADEEALSASMLHDVESIARLQNIYLLEVRPQSTVRREQDLELSVRMQAEGTTAQLVSFFAELMRTKRLYTVETFRIIPHPEDVNKVRASVTLLRVVFKDTPIPDHVPRGHVR